MSARHIALVPAAGTGSRMGASKPKQYLDLLGQPLVLHTLRALHAVAALEMIAIVLAPDDRVFDALDLAGLDRLKVLRCGGASRAETVRNGLDALGGVMAANDWVLVHDAARPCLGTAAVERLMTTLADDPVGGLLALPVADTVKRADANACVAETVPRTNLWLAQTPQMFRARLLMTALARDDLASVTDEASAIEALGLRPRLVLGDVRNLKVTYPEDLAWAAHGLRTGS
jgi:2-C-methyl-D-erythritol 4-phosphate cytidylyltransferase